MIPARFVPVGYLDASINRASFLKENNDPQSCFDVRLCQTFPDRFHHVLVKPARRGGRWSHSWSVDEHDPLAVQLKLVGHLDSVAPSPPQMRPTNAVYELRLQSLESENGSDRLCSSLWFSRAENILPH